MDELCNDHGERGEEREPQPVPGFTRLHNAYEITKAFFYQHSNEIGVLSAET